MKRIDRHNLFLLSSSISYYAALGLAPLLLIILGIASLIGEDIKHKIISQVSMIAPELQVTLDMIFANLKDQVDIGSISGIFGVALLLFLASFLFVQMRYSLDLIYGDLDIYRSKSVGTLIKERGTLMVVVIIMCVLFIFSLLINPIFEYLLVPSFKVESYTRALQIFLNFIVLFFLFMGLYFFTPSKRKKIKQCAQMSLLTSVAFLFGNYLTGLYMKNFAMDSLYGAAGALLIFLLWTFYSSLTLFMSVEIFEFLKRPRA